MNNTLRKIVIARITQKITQEQKCKLKYDFMTLVSARWLAKPKHKK